MKTTAKSTSRYCKAAVVACLLVSSCYTFEPVHIIRRIEIKPVVARTAGSVDAYDEIREGLADANTLIKRRPVRNFRKITAVRHLAVMRSRAPLARINNRAVRLTLAGRFAEAGILFREVLKEDSTLSGVYNNLGIINEINGNHAEAFAMYTTACLLDPDCEQYRENFLDSRSSGE